MTGQRWVPVLVHGDDVIHDSHRILEYLEWLDRQTSRRQETRLPRRPDPQRRARRPPRVALVLMAWERWQSLAPEEKERYKKQARDYAQRGALGRAAHPQPRG